MRQALKLAAFGIILLLSKTEAYLSNTDPSETQSAPERAISRSVTHWNVNSMSDPTIFEGKQVESSTCAAKLGHDPSDTATIHAMHESLKGS
jgi:hypothetical protein